MKFITFSGFLEITAGSVISGLLLFLAFPNASISILAYIAFVPLLIACARSSSKVAFACGLLSSFIANVGIYYWIFEVSNFKYYHFLILGTYLGIYTALWCAVLPFLVERGTLFAPFAAAGWVTLDYLKSNLGFLAFPWASLAHTQHAFPPIIQIAEFTGEYGVTFVVMFVNAAIAKTLLDRNIKSLVVAATLVACVVLWGVGQLSQSVAGNSIRIAAIQPAKPKLVPGTGFGNQMALNILEKLTAESSQGNPDLFVWPESAFFRWRLNPNLVARIQKIVEIYGTPIVTGVAENRKFAQTTTDNGHLKRDRLIGRMQNSAFYFGIDGHISGPYNKNLLVPFAEYTPLSSFVKWPKWIIESNPDSDVKSGSEYVAFSLPNGVKMVPIICWENLFADFVRRSIKPKPSVLLHLVNDNWFGNTSAAPQHNTASVFRAVENRTPVVIASNTGPSQIIDAYGRVLASVPEMFSTGIAVADINPGEKTTFYSQHGDIFMIFLTVLFICGCVPILVRKSIVKCDSSPN